MRHRSKVALAATASVLVLGAAAAITGPMIYRDFFAPPPLDAPHLSFNDTERSATLGEALDPAELSGEWQVVQGSSAGYRVNEELNGTAVTVTGRTAQVSGNATIDGLSLQQATFTVDVASIATESAARDSYFRDEALRASEFPTARFELGDPITLDSAPVTGEIITHAVSGELTIAGVTRPVTFTAQVQSDGATTRIAGSIDIVFADFDVQAPNLGFVKVEPQGQVEFDLTLEKR